jgi:hypothetical protein
MIAALITSSSSTGSNREFTDPRERCFDRGEGFGP